MVLLNSKHAFHHKSQIFSIFFVRCPSLLALRSLSGGLSSEIMKPTRDAHTLFDQMLPQDYKFCNALIKFHAAKRQDFEVLSALKWMQITNFTPDRLAMAASIKASALLCYGIHGKAIHAFAVKASYNDLLPVEKALMDMYARIGALDDSFQVFESSYRKDSVSWNVMLAGFARAQLYMEAMEMLYKMHVSGGIQARLTAITMAIILPICAKLKLLEHGKCLHACILKMGMESETLAGNSLVSMYAKCGGAVNDAWEVFDMISGKDIISWNSMIAGLSENGFFSEALELFYQMVSVGFMPNDATLVSVLPVCSFLENGWLYGKEIHGYILRSELDEETSVNNALLIHYLKAGDIVGSENIFQKMKRRDLVTWNTLISGYAMNGWFSEAMNLYHNLLRSGMKPNSLTLISLLPCCGQLLDFNEGRKIHDYILQHPSLGEETSLGNALVSFYGKCGKVDEATQCFQGILKKDLISWNAMLTAFADNGQWEKLLKLLNQMNNVQIQPDSITIATVLRACTSLCIMKVREAHGYSFRAGLISRPNVINAILGAYANCRGIEENSIRNSVPTNNAMILSYLKHGSLKDAEKLFNQMPERDLSTWNLMLQLYIQNGCIDKAFILFHELQKEGRRPDIVSIMSVLSACAHVSFVHLVKQCHGYTIRASLEVEHLGAALLDAYSKCGSITDACRQFQITRNKDLITFTTMIQGYAIHGMAEEALQTFSQMLESNIKPDHVILTSLLSACSHGGLIEQGWEHFNSISKVHGIKPTMEHYACMVDLLSRRGWLKEAYGFIKDMPCEANANVWGSLLGSCGIHGEVEIGRIAADQLFGVEGLNIGNYVVMSNIYAADGRWDGVEEVRRMMKMKDMRKPAGCSWIEVERKSHVFVVTDFSHPQRYLIFSILKGLELHMKDRAVRLAQDLIFS
ncbi:putative pentatricopeptide repeat-containing protein At5g08490 [Phalaenopsis equestris]|uniref:putative pentatricopeptide repeat-containing protein At5g08490 n=1 Tax=Phalaenopsis equestris TaxID=78828 RepID=UPI0009E5F2E7|nr:putative pentatricopeptide repeat-containing protein At5g08490 [Phalaenopsis equestris]